MKKFICMMLASVMALSMAACGGRETASVSTDGSTSMQKVIGALGEAFMEETGANFTYNATGFGYPFPRPKAASQQPWCWVWAVPLGKPWR